MPSNPRIVTIVCADVADSLRGVDRGMQTLQAELDVEVAAASGEKHQAGAAAAAGGGPGGGGVVTRRQAAYESGLAAAAAAAASEGAGEGSGACAESGDVEPPPVEQEQAAAGAAAALPPFAAMLERFLVGARLRQAELDAAALETRAAVRSAVAWLGEAQGGAAAAAAGVGAAGDHDVAVFEQLFAFASQFDQSARWVHRQLAAAAAANAAAAGPAARRSLGSARR